MENIIKIKNVSKNFGKTEVLKDLSLDINKGERLVIVGPNGSGKSTLVNIITDILKPTSGEVSFPGFKGHKDFTSILGVQFQENSLPAGYKVKEIIELMFEINYDSSRFPDRKKWEIEIKGEWKENLIKKFRLSDLQNRKVQKLSGGQKQSLNIMLSFVSKPKLLILDEITTGLDIKAQERYLDFIDDYIKETGSTLIIVSHILKEIFTLGERIAILDKGRIVSDKKMKNIGKTANSIDKFLRAYFIEGVIK